MSTRWTTRYFDGLGICRFAPPDDGDDDDDHDDKPKGGGKPEETVAYWKAESEKWKGLSKKHETTSKANATAAAKLKELEDGQKSELDKAKDAQTKAEEKASGTERELARLRVAMKKGLSESQAKRLNGNTEEELESDADELLKTFSLKKSDNNGDDDEDDTSKNERPKEKLKSGFKSGDSGPVETDPIKLAATIPRSGSVIF